METVKVLNIDIQNITRQELLENLKEGVLVTPNLDHLIKLQKDKMLTCSIVNVLFSATPHYTAVFQPVMWITQKNDFPSLTYILI